MSARAWLGILLPPATWFAHLLACMWSTTDLCGYGHATAPRVVVGVLSLAGIALSLFGAACGYGELVHARNLLAVADTTVLRPEGRTRGEYVGVAGVLAGCLFAIAIALAGLPMILLSDVCEAVR